MAWKTDEINSFKSRLPIGSWFIQLRIEVARGSCHANTGSQRAVQGWLYMLLHPLQKRLANAIVLCHVKQHDKAHCECNECNIAMEKYFRFLLS